MERSELLRKEAIGMQRVRSSKDQVRIKNNLLRQNLIPESDTKVNLHPQIE